MAILLSTIELNSPGSILASFDTISRPITFTVRLAMPPKVGFGNCNHKDPQNDSHSIYERETR
jgi:hypothetical protein